MLRKVKTINEIFSEVKDYDLVITNDAPLATALNKLIEKPRLGYLAMTPRQIASKFAQLYYEKLHEKFEVVIKISRILDKPAKLIHQTVEKIYEVWNYNAKLEFSEQFLSTDELSLLELIKETDTIETAMENFNEDFYGDKRIAVIGEELFSLLDLEVLPKRGEPARKIEIFSEDEFNIDKTYIFSSSEHLISSIMKLVNSKNADETAIVLDPNSDHLEILKARFKDAGIKIEIKNYLSDNMQVRNFISLIELSFRINELKVKEFSPLACVFEIYIDSRFGQYDISNYMKSINRDSNLKILYSISENILNRKYSDLLNELKKNFRFEPGKEFKELLELLDLTESKITVNNLIELKYFLKEFDIEMNSERSGVLFVNSLNSAYIDRQIIFYLGMDNSWMTLFPDKDYMNKEDEEKKNLKRFQILLQQGKKRFYFVQNVTDYKDVIPCYYFHMLSDSDTGSFLNAYFNPQIVESEKKEYEYTGAVRKQVASKLEITESISPTDINNYYRCPKLYSLKKLLPSEDLPVLKRGTLLHEFAELYFNCPDYANENFGKIREIMTEKMSVFLKKNNSKYISSEFEIGMEYLKKFIDEISIQKTELSEPKTERENMLMKELGLDVIYANTESRINDTEVTHIKGKIDLQYGNNIVDYKSSRKRKMETEVTIQSSLDYINQKESDDFDFQAIAYIAYISKGSHEVNFFYNYLLNNFKHQIDNSYYDNFTENLTGIKYMPMTFYEYIYSEKVFEIIKSDTKGDVLMNKLGYENYKFILDNLNLVDKDYFNRELLNSKIIEVTNFIVKEMGFSFSDFNKRKQKTFDENIEETIGKYIYNIRIGKRKTGLIFKDDLDKFLELVNRILKELNEYSNSAFPFKPAFGSRDVCKSCDYLNLCMGNKLWH